MRFTGAVNSGVVWLTELQVWSTNGSSTQRFDAWGNPAGSTGSSIPTFGFTGREGDASGLVYMRARYYSPALGRFISRDPIGLQGGINAYAYADGNPISNNDPSGLIANSVSNTVTNYAGQVQSYFNQPLVRDTFSTIGTGAKAAVGNIFADTINGAASWGEQFTHSDPGSFGRVDAPVTITNPIQQQVANDLRGVAGTALAFTPLLSGGNSFASTIANDSSTVRYGPLNQGPLAQDVANTFRSGTYTGRTLSSDTTLYRVISDNGNPTGSYWTSVKPQGPLQSVIDSALDQNWGNTATRTITATVPKGTTIFEGSAAAQRGLVGGGNQIYIPKVDPSWIVH